MDDFADKIASLTKQGILTDELGNTLQNFYLSYIQSAKQNQLNTTSLTSLLFQFLELLLNQLKNPFAFEIYHQAIKEPFNYYQFGLDFIRPLIKFSQSSLRGIENIQKINAQLSQKENVILLANHQTEPDPQIISLLLEKNYPELAENMIFVAGHRVTSDPLTVPFSLGRNLLCIYSKRYIEDPPEKKEEKLLHNQRTLKKMYALLSEGGKCIYVAPSGGRDRPNAEGIVEVAPFDPQSTELFWIFSQKVSQKTHFYPLSLFSYPLLTPPDQIQKELGEPRLTKVTPVHLAFGSEINMAHLADSKSNNKKEARAYRAQCIWNLVNELYQSFY